VFSFVDIQDPKQESEQIIKEPKAKQTSIKRRVGYRHEDNRSNKKEKMNVDDNNTGHASIVK
jgi:hypothetical protein